ncbi:MAG: hypothetical protein CMG75_05830 [Candidatus Marinimicrobia bacterium]|nr:hypothetical protein [Candidatus Neomarinimicrobiota bacterium]
MVSSVEASKCLNHLMSKSIDIKEELNTIYGDQLSLIDDRFKSLKIIVENFIKYYGDNRKIIISRAPGRVNLMGRHIDHQGGYVNTIAINKEILLVASSRQDYKVNIRNIENLRFPENKLDPHSLLEISKFSDWKDFVRSKEVLKLNKKIPDDWSMYILAIYYRLQLNYPKFKLTGVDCLFGGNIPVGSGLSSSSALGVVFSLALLNLNKINLSKEILIEMIGEAELFLGFDGGKADPAAIISAEKGKVSTIGFFPFHILCTTQIPKHLKIIIAYSGIEAKKVGEKKDIFNQRVASYKLAMMILRKKWSLSKNISHLRDLMPNKLNIPVSELYHGLLSLPNNPTRNDIISIMGPEYIEILKEVFMTHVDPDNYDLLGVTLFGLSECARSENFYKILEKRNYKLLKTFVNLSHNGDRLVLFDSFGNYSHYDHLSTKDHLVLMVKNQPSLVSISGNYSCSIKEIDKMVDIVNSIPGTIGAQIAGAGMGGNMTILVKDNSEIQVMDELRNKYYKQQNISFEASITYPISGASIFKSLQK